ncbi:MAG TPA: glycoside hydrolase family 88 protein [Niabella sp.]|nr:glycoside hydrolase family 88 protein [Niabella sp.]HOZ95441.1 glycoside hydrolase family 88 protein [Niabella sp.]HQW14331.1 glycoside hydrolase family 88 protein [Niabella sp.]HQX18390.1 glycoside hydrolase family 88 protein [Niabella sp.]HQX40118.1 glycoside hydrolase family 88 protein [Niabella sp.]
MQFKFLKSLTRLFAIFSIVLTGCAHSSKIPQSNIDKVVQVAEQQYTKMLAASTDLTKYPRTSNPDGSVKYVSIRDWTGGFWPGSLWYLYDLTKKTNWKEDAIKWTESLESNQYNTIHHDIGFMMYCSYGNALRNVKNEKYKDVLVQSAKSLIKRYDPRVGSIKSWNAKESWDGHTWYYPVIIDNMMNLELLFYASKVTGDPVYRNIAIKHAETTMKNHLRPDYSSYHVVDYDTATGKVLHQQTNQGFSDNSQWARGQGWGIYGFTVMYRETKDNRFLITAQKMADYYINHPNMPADKIPYWDFNAGQPGYVPDWKYDASKFSYVPRDASAASLIASALLELNKYLPDGKKYYRFAVESLNSLCTPAYLAAPGTNSNFILKHSTGSIPHNTEVDVPLMYADYYFLEALLRYKNMLNY